MYGFRSPSDSLSFLLRREKMEPVDQSEFEPEREMEPQSDQTLSSQTAFPFFELPQEVRDIVYAHLISGIRVPIKKYQGEPQHCYGILMASKQTHKETLKVFYSTTIFVIEENWARRGVEWLAALPIEYRDWLTRVIFRRDLMSSGNMYSKIAYRALSEQNQQAMLLEPFLKELKQRGIILRDGVLRA